MPETYQQASNERTERTRVLLDVMAELAELRAENARLRRLNQAVEFESSRYWTNTAENTVTFVVDEPPWGRGGKMGNDPRLVGVERVRVVVLAEEE